MELYGNNPDMELYYELEEKYPGVDIEIPKLLDPVINQINANTFERIFYPLIVYAMLNKLGPRWKSKIGISPIGLTGNLELIQYRAALDEVGKIALIVNIRELAKNSEYFQKAISMIKQCDRNGRTEDMYYDVLKRWRLDQYTFENVLTKQYINERLQHLAVRTFSDFDKLMIISLWRTM
jgi:hypothetical protein